MGWLESAITELNKQRLYRVFRLGRFLELLRERRNTLTRPALWGDPWEEWWTKFIRKGVRSWPAIVFGQCWTAVEESDAMWRVYAPLGDGVKVSTRYSVLLESLSDLGRSEGATVENVSVVQVVYKSEGELKKLGHHFSKIEKEKPKNIDLHTRPEYMIDEYEKDVMTTWLLQTLYGNKRKAFDWEREFRLMARCRERLGADTLSYPIDPRKVIHEVVFDPRMDETICGIVKEYTRKVGLTCPVYRSRLYSLDLSSRRKKAKG